MPRRSIFITLAVALSALLAGCGTNALTPNAGVNTGDKAYHIAFVPPGFTSPFHVEIASGARAEAQKLGWNIDVQAPASENDFVGQVTMTQQLLERGLDAIAVNPIQIEAMVVGVKAANAKKIPFFFYNFITPVSDGKVTAYIGYDQWGGAEKLGIYTCKLLARKQNTTPDQATGKVFILLGIESIFSHRRTQGYLAGLSETCPGVKVVGQQSAAWLRETGANVATAALQRIPNIDVFYGNSDEMAIGASLAAESLGMKINKDFFAISIDGNQATLDLIKQGKYTATLGVDPARMATTVVDAMKTVLDGGTVPQYILTPSVVVDASNLQDYIDGSLWAAPVAGSPELDNGKPLLTTSSPQTTR